MLGGDELWKDITNCHEMSVNVRAAWFFRCGLLQQRVERFTDGADANELALPVRGAGGPA